MNTKSMKKLYEYLIKNPDAIIQVHRHRIMRKTWILTEHSHDNILQFDFCCGCNGFLMLDGEKIPVKGNMAMIHYHNVRHGYELKAETNPSVFYTAKIIVPDTQEFMKEKEIPAVQSLSPACRALHFQFDRLYRIALSESCNPFLKLSMLMELMALWPDGGKVREWEILNSQNSGESGDPFETALDIIENEFVHQIKVDDLAQKSGISRRQLERRFKDTFGMGPQDYINMRRVKVAQENLSQDKKPVYAVAADLGFNSVHHFSRWFSRNSGKSPSSFRKENDSF